MTDKQPDPDKADRQANPAQSIRDRAEEKVRAQKPHYPESGLPPVTREMLHELRVHQAGLETRNVELEAANARYFDLYNLAPVGYLAINVEDLILEANPTVFNLLGMERSRLTNQRFTGLIVPEDQDIYSLFRKKLLETGLPQTCELRVTRQDGGWFWAGMKMSIAEDTERAEAVCHAMMSDISERKRVEIELRQAKEQAEAATKLKDKFVEMVAHDLRSPFTSMMGLMRHFVERKHLLENEDDKKVLDTVFKNGDRMIAMIEDLLKISRLQTGKIAPQFRFFKGQMAAANTIGSLSHNAWQKGIVIINEVSLDTRLYADQSLFEEVLLNLLSNAIKFCSRGNEITVFAPPGVKSAIAVRDNGKGINEKNISDIFRYEVATTTPGTAGELGTGLGLPFSRDIMQAHGGDITVESAPGKGSVFCATLPYVKPVALIVDDNQDMLLILRLQLEKIGLDIIEALDGKKALEAMKDKLPHIVITDIQMPVMDGFALLDHLKQDISTRGIPVIMITGSDGETREKALMRGADDFVGKPLNPEDFIPRVRRFVG